MSPHARRWKAITMPGDDTGRRLPRRRHLRRLDRITAPGPALFLVTVNVRSRERVLASAVVCSILVDAWQHAESAHGWLIGRYVVMPDHVHFFASPRKDEARGLSRFMNYWKRSTATKVRKEVHPAFAWQPEFHDHLLRSAESYAGKWGHVRLNPVRAGLVVDGSEWPFQGELNTLKW